MGTIPYEKREPLLNERNDRLHFEPVYWGYSPKWWKHAPLINARGETASSGRMFKPLWHQGRAVVPADGWYEWAKTDKGNQRILFFIKLISPCFLPRLEKLPITAITVRKGLSSSLLKATRAWLIYTTGGHLFSVRKARGSG